MGASDCIVTKAGPGTIAEASTRGLPVMLFNFLPGQEEVPNPPTRPPNPPTHVLSPFYMSSFIHPPTHPPLSLQGNVPFVVDGGFGDYKKDPRAIGKVVRLTHPPTHPPLTHLPTHLLKQASIRETLISFNHLPTSLNRSLLG